MSSSFMADISSLGAEVITAKKSTSRSGNTEMKMEDFLTLMVVQLQNQTLDETADTGDMLNQLVQMQMVTALSNMTDASVMSYASSLVGKEVTIGTVDKDNNLQKNVLTVTGTGLYSGEQVIFCDDGNMYQLNQVMAVGRLPEREKDEENEALNETEAEANARIDKLVNDIKNGNYDPDGTKDSGNAADIGAVKEPESAQQSDNDSVTRNDDGTIDPLKAGLPDGTPANANQADAVYNGEQGAPTDED